MTTDSAIQAGSLSALNLLAANPPQYPVNPAETKQDPLVLYISRVPGTRDIILSTSKPQLKNVTSQDVSNSLYYIHLELPGEATHTPPPRRSGTPRSSEESRRSGHNQIPRKPVPKGVNDANQTEEAPSSEDSDQAQRPEHDQRQTQTRSQLPSQIPPDKRQSQYHQVDGAAPPVLQPRTWSADGRTHYTIEDPPKLGGTSVTAKPLGPRPLQPRRPVPTTPPGQIDLNRELPPLPTENPAEHAPQSQPQPEPQPRPRPRHQHRHSSHIPLSAQARHSMMAPEPPLPRSRSPSPVKFHNGAAVPYVLHLIRRDPSTGHQWNIGRISSSQLEGSLDESYEYTSFDRAGLGAADSRKKTSAPQPEIHVALETSGYAKFRDMPSRQSIDAARKLAGFHDSQGSLPRASPSTPGDEDSPAARRPPEFGFHRELVMTYTKSWTAGLREKFAARAGDRNTSPFMTRHRRHVSDLTAVSRNSFASFDDFEEPTPPAIITQPGHGLRPKGYMFESPWEGICRFRTGNGGNSLKLRHILPGNTGGYNPLVAAQSTRSPTSGLSTGRATDVSELRFAIPGRELFQPGKHEAAARKMQLSGQFGRLIRGQRTETDLHDDDDERGADDRVSPLGLWLGKERAGGGNRGRKAKMGKLIVYGDGMKMLDLVVAANIGVWWGAWERSF